MSVIYKITKRIWGNTTTQSAPVRYRNGYGLTTERKQATRWVQHFQEFLNHPEPGGPASPPQAEDVLEINISPPTEAEVRAAIKAMKSGKASGTDSIHAKMLRAYIGTSTKLLTDLFITIWTKDNIPADWTKGFGEG